MFIGYNTQIIHIYITQFNLEQEELLQKQYFIIGYILLGTRRACKNGTL